MMLPSTVLELRCENEVSCAVITANGSIFSPFSPVQFVFSLFYTVLFLQNFINIAHATGFGGNNIASNVDFAFKVWGILFCAQTFFIEISL